MAEKLRTSWLGGPGFGQAEPELPELPEPEPKAPKPTLIVERRRLPPTKVELGRAKHAAVAAEHQRQAVERQAQRQRQVDLHGIAPGIGRGAGRQARARVGWA